MIGQSPTYIANNRGFSDLPSCRDGLALLNQIARQSRKGIKVDSELKDVYKANRFTPSLFALTANESKNFSFLKGRLTPKKVYCEVIDDKEEIYENRFAAYCLHKLSAELEVAYARFREDSSLLHSVGSIGYSRWGNAKNALSFMNEHKGFADGLQEVSRLRNEALLLQSTSFYFSLKPLGEEEIHSTNALSYDPLYGALYRLYLGYRSKKGDGEIESRLLKDLNKCAKLAQGKADSLPAAYFYDDFLLKLRHYGDRIEVRIADVYDQYSRKYELRLDPGFFYPYMSIIGGGRERKISLFGAEDYSLPLLTLCAKLEASSICPLCGGRIGEDGLCRSCKAGYHYYEGANGHSMWAYDLPFATKESSYE